MIVSRTLGTVAAAALLVLGLARPASAEVQVSGSFSGGSSAIGSFQFSGTFQCTGMPTCAGQYTAAFRDQGCSNYINVSDAIVVSGMDLAYPGAIAGNISLRNGEYNDVINPDGTCSIRPGTQSDLVLPFTGTWDGSAGTFFIRLPDDMGGTVTINGAFTATGVPAVFPMTVSGSIGPVIADVSATFEFRPQDVGSNPKVFVFALAPATVVRPMAGIDASPLRIQARGGKADVNVACVLAQLNSGGQLQQVSASQMQAFVSGVISAQGGSVKVLDGIPTVQIAGASFFLGYGASSQSMLDGGVNRRVATAPGTVRCEPQKPQSGWWWNPAEPGRGFSLEVQGTSIFFASFLYDATGRATWYAAAGPLTLEGSLFSGRKLESYSGGQTLQGAYRPATGPVQNGDVTLAFNDATHGTLVWPGGAVPIQRFEFGGLGAAAQQGQPEGGWWWNPQEGGRGFFMEWQGTRAFLAGYMYDAAGNPIWYAAEPSVTDPARIDGTWYQMGNGQTLGGAYRAPTAANPSVGPATITFQSPDAALMTLPGGRTTSLTRFRF